MRLRPQVVLPLALLMFILAALVYVWLAQPAFPGAPKPENTLSPGLTATPLELGSFETLSGTISRTEAARLQQTEVGRRQLLRSAGAIPVTTDLIALGRRAFYTQTFGNEAFFSDMMGVLDGPINLFTVGRAVTGLRGQATTNLQIRIRQEVTVGGQTFPAGTVLDTGLDVPKGWLVPLGMRIKLVGGKAKIGVSCALCHAAVDDTSGKVIEGLPNADLDTGLILAMASNSAPFFRNTGVNPLEVPQGEHAFIASDGAQKHLPDAKRLEDHVDTDLLAWPPGNFDSTADLVNNPSQIPSSFTFGTHPYGWNGFSAVGWFQGLTTLNNNVHALNSDPSTGIGQAPKLFGMEQELYIGTLLQNAASRSYRLPEAAQPTTFFSELDPTSLGPALNQVEPMPAYPNGSVFIPDGLMVNTPGLPFAEELNAISAWQNSLAPPANEQADLTQLERGAEVFTRAGCAACHNGRYFTNNRVIPLREIGTQPSRALALAAFTQVFVPPQTYAPSESVPVEDGEVLVVPVIEAQRRNLDIAYTVSNPAGGYKVQNLIGLRYTAPYLHDGGVAAGAGAFDEEAGRYRVADTKQLGLAGTLLAGRKVDAASSLRALVDRQLRTPLVIANRANTSLQRAHTDGSGHAYWVDEAAGFRPRETDDLIAFLLSLDDEPIVMPTE